jgi:hypothetical protein
MNGWHTRSALVAILALAAACSTVKYSSDYDPQASFTAFKTYDWILPTEDEQAALERANPFLERRLQRAVESELSDRGFVKNTGGEPDVLVSVYPIVPDRRADQRGRAAPRGAYRSPVNVSVGFGVAFGRPYRYGYGYPGFGYRYPYYGFRYPHFGYPYSYGFGYPYFAISFPVYGYARRGYAPGGALGGVAPGTLVVDVVDARTEELVWRGWAEGAMWELPRPEQLDKYVDEVVAKVMKGFPPPGLTH